MLPVCCAGLEVNSDRPHNKLPYRGAWLWIGPEMIHLMELENPDPMHRPEVGCLSSSYAVMLCDRASVCVSDLKDLCVVSSQQRLQTQW